MDLTHLNALQARLSDERARLASATKESERQIRQVWVAQLEKEIAGELEFLGLGTAPTMDEIMSDDELLAALTD